MIGSLNTVTVAQIALGGVLVVAVIWRMYRQRADFPSRRRYAIRNLGAFLMLVGVVLAEAHTLFGYPGHFLTAGAIVACVGVALFVWGNNGMVRPGVK
jgi:hypothetical protein